MKKRRVFGCLAATGVLAAGSLVAVVLLATGLVGVAHGSIPVRIVVVGGRPEEPIRVEEAWYTNHPGSEGWVPLWPGGERVQRPVRVDSTSVSATLRRGSWCLFRQRLELTQVGTLRFQPDTPTDPANTCEVQAHDGDLRVEVADQPPRCIAYDPERTRSIEVTVDVTPLNLVFARAPRDVPNDDGRLSVEAGSTTVFELSGSRLGGTWPLTKAAPFDAPLTAVVVDRDTWDRVLGPWTGTTPRRVTRQRWDELVEASAHSALDWGVQLEGDRLRITAPDRPGDVVRVGVAGFGEGDPRAQPGTLWLEVVPRATTP